MSKRIIVNTAANESNELTESIEQSIAVQGETIQGTILQRKGSVARRDDKWQGAKFPFTVQIDFSGVSSEQLYSWAASTLIIQLQNQMRQCSPEFMSVLTSSAIRRPAADMGKSMNADERAEASAKRAITNLSAIERRRLLIESALAMGDTVSKADKDWLAANKA